MKRILVAVDGSPHTLKGVRWAAELAGPLGLAVALVYVSFPNLLPPTVYAQTIADIEVAEAAHAAKVLREARESIADVKVQVLETRGTGGPAEVIADLAAADGVWGVVVGAKGHGAVSRVMLGSIADRLVHICPKPIVVIR